MLVERNRLLPPQGHQLPVTACNHATSQMRIEDRPTHIFNLPTSMLWVVYQPLTISLHCPLNIRPASNFRKLIHMRSLELQYSTTHLLSRHNL